MPVRLRVPCRRPVWFCLWLAVAFYFSGTLNSQESVGDQNTPVEKTTDQETADPINFSREILPILSDRCFHCHGPDEAVREAELRLDVRDSALGLDGSTGAIVPGNIEQSTLLERISSDDEDLLMPPPGSGRKKLTIEQIELIKKWIEQGAKWQKHWAYVAPKRPEIPIADRHPIDAFIQRQLESSGLSLSPSADRRVLIRRLSLDLTGMPPTPKEVADFLEDDSEKAYEKVVDRLLSSSRFGERMAWPWLDAARYADSSGYQGDPTRTMWPWRDWAISAINANMPFDQFTIEQLAGDLLPNASDEQRLATGFNRNHMHNSEGGRIAEETRIENVFDRAETTATVWLGMTLNCARCHDHKYDPTSNEEYFQFFDFFNQTSEQGRVDQSVAVPPAMDFVPPHIKQELQELDTKIERARRELLVADETADQHQREWEANWLKKSKIEWSGFAFNSARSTQGATIKYRDDRFFHVTGERPEKDIYELKVTSPLKQIRSVRLDAKVDPKSPGKGTGRDEKGNFVLSEIELFARPVGASGDFQKVEFASADADFWQGELTPQKAIDGIVGNDNGWAVSGHTRKEPRYAIFQLREMLQSDRGFELKFRLRFESQHTHHTLALFQLRLAESPATLQQLDKKLEDILRKTDQRSPAEMQTLRMYFRSQVSDAFRSQVKKIDQLKKEKQELVSRNKPVKVMVMDSLAKPRDTYILVKGIYNDKTDKKVVAGTPSMLPKIDIQHERPNRLDLAKWLVSKNNPLTARVTVNRFWQTLFGRGLVETPNDFGLQGKQPSHPELLDWLAVDFVESGWDVKRLIKQIVMSDTYRQSSRVTPKMLQVDPENRLLGRSPRYRLPSWMIRDQALASSGLLVDRVGGPPVKPYQPAGVWSEATFGKKKYATDSGENLYRRSIYTFWRRIVGPTMFFDAAKRQTCEVKPSRTNTPLHALTVLNDKTFVEAARVLAQSAMQSKKEFGDRLDFIFMRLCARAAEPREHELLQRTYQSIREEFLSNPTNAKSLLSVGNAPTDATLDAVDHAALATLVNMLMNLDEVLVRP